MAAVVAAASPAANTSTQLDHTLTNHVSVVSYRTRKAHSGMSGVRLLSLVCHTRASGRKAPNSEIRGMSQQPILYDEVAREGPAWEAYSTSAEEEPSEVRDVGHTCP